MLETYKEFSKENSQNIFFTSESTKNRPINNSIIVPQNIWLNSKKKFTFNFNVLDDQNKSICQRI